MAGFKTHITTSTVLGVGYGATAHFVFGLPPATCALAGGLCSVSGMLPDLDSGSGVPLRESMAFAAAVVPMLMLPRFQELGLSHEMMALIGGGIYLTIRFGFTWLLKRYTVHRGMWHSLPAAAIAGLAAFLICDCGEMDLRIFKASAVVVGFMSHLLLDEIYSIEWKGGLLRFKKSFGTAIKFWSKSRWANVSTYGKLLLLAAAAFGDPIMMNRFHPLMHTHPQASQQPNVVNLFDPNLLKR